MATRLGTLFVSTGNETVMSWFVARASGQRGTVEEAKKAYAKLILSTVKDDLTKLGFSGIELKWSRKAGCRCGCSPGYAIKVSGHKKPAVMSALGQVKEKSYFIRYDFEDGKLGRRANPVTINNSRYSYTDSSSVEVLRLLGIRGDKTIATTKDFR
jgi:hypothetical protein